MYYRLYFMSPRSGHIDRAENIHAESDGQAIESARPFAGEQPLELWQDNRKVYRFETKATEMVSVAPPSRSHGGFERSVVGNLIRGR